MLYHIIASGSKGNATIIHSGNTVILIDMGIPFSRLEEGLNEINLTFNDIDAALFTHDHSDHINGLRFIPIKKQYALEGGLPSNGFNEISLFNPFIIKDLVITPIKTSHDATNPCGYVIESKKEKLVYFTDTGVFPEINYPFVRNPDYLILECNHDISMLMKTNRPMELKTRILSDHGHLSNEDSALIAKEIIGDKTKEITLAHISEEANAPEVALEAYRRIFSYFGIDINKYLLRVANQRVSLTGGKNED